MEKDFYTVKDVVEIIGEISTATAYRIIRELNKEIREKFGKRTKQGRVSVKYFREAYGLEPMK